MKGVILAGGKGKRMYPVTCAISKHLIPLYDKPMIYYPICFLFQCNIRDLIIILNRSDYLGYYSLLGDGTQWGANITYICEDESLGTGCALVKLANHIIDDNFVLIYGDNYIKSNLACNYITTLDTVTGATIFSCEVNNPSNYGVIEISQDNQVLSIEEKSSSPKSNSILIGLFCFDNTAIQKAKAISISSRGEYEITDILKMYLSSQQLHVVSLEKNAIWSDLGTPIDILNTANAIFDIERSSGIKEGCPEEIALKKHWISKKNIMDRISVFSESQYGKYIKTRPDYIKLCEED